ncbi:MAG: hypothetical protein KatS3mg118_2127 [Paracoccaceae bacterium]|nr:MAG: hypothetical protein KatS3mg118_2127 [Paracoccaceae bacterium]
MLAPETNGEVAVKAWAGAVRGATGRDHTHLALGPSWTRRSASADVAGPAAQDHLLAHLVGDRRAEKVCYNAGWTNVHELIPWRTLTGRQQTLPGPPVDARLRRGASCTWTPARRPEDRGARRSSASEHGDRELVLNFITPHQKWGIHSTYTPTTS